MDESKSTEHLDTEPLDESKTTSSDSRQPEVDDGYEAWVAEPVPQYVIEAYEGFVADLKDLFAHSAANPSDRWVAYRGKQRLGFGANQTPLYNECLAKFPDRQFVIYSISEQPDYTNTVTVV